jgi:hypothetical protein
MKKLVFEGHSDDTFGEYESFKDDYDCCASGALIAFKLTDRDGNGLIVCGQYGESKWPKPMPACWVVGVSLLDEDTPIPNWPMAYTYEGYSPILTIIAPDDVTMECLNRKDKD